jgi:hypothetical protein
LHYGRQVNRSIVIAAALGLSAAELSASLWYPVPVYVASGCGASLALVVGLAAAWRRNRRPPAAFLVDERDRGFRTPVYANGLLMGLACLQITVFFLAVIRETRVGMLGAGLFAVLLAGQWRALRYGHGLTLHAGGIEAAKSAGTVSVPWEALTVPQPGRGDNWWEIKLDYTRPDLVTATGWVHDRTVVTFEGANPDFVAAAIATYAAEPGRRHAIGTQAELERLQAGMAGPLPVTAQIVEPASTRMSVRRLVIGLVLFLGACAVAGIASGWWEALAMPFGLAGAHQIYLAVGGWRAARRARPTPAATETATTARSR